MIFSIMECLNWTYIMQVVPENRLLVESLMCVASDGQNLQGVPSNVTDLFSTSSHTMYSLFLMYHFPTYHVLHKRERTKSRVLKSTICRVGWNASGYCYVQL
ncbi:hypothetical protein R3W88_007277 [Solanum pinnatisectum]|uniref:Uncharacterized protein n=1 Tax=Solanum pinnatisectum TaxID=50273 RepID=A0AAV9M4T3_9SOLN|nr:hypothetical protein R3W88_007277 [Solanum pinnatisectum]